MSQLSTLKQQIQQIAQTLATTAQSLNGYSTNLSTQISAVNNAIGGTATNEDKDMIASLQSAQTSVNNAARQLSEASKKAKDWAAKA